MCEVIFRRNVHADRFLGQNNFEIPIFRRFSPSSYGPSFLTVIAIDLIFFLLNSQSKQLYIDYKYDYVCQYGHNDIFPRGGPL